MIPDDIELMAEWLGREDPVIQRLLRTLGRDHQMESAVRDILRRRCRAIGLDPANPPAFAPIREFPDGDVLLGQVCQSGSQAQCSVPVEVCREHIGLFGHTGMGKTSLAKQIVTILAHKDCRLWVMDVEDEYGNLLNMVGSDAMVAVRADQLRFNLFQPPSSCIPTGSWLEEINLLLRGGTFLRDGSLNLFRSGMLKLLSQSATSSGPKSSQAYPAMVEVLQRFENMGFGPNSRNRGYLDSLINRFNMLRDTFPNTFTITSSTMLEELARRNVIFRLHELKGIPLQFMVGFLLMWLMRYREANPSDTNHAVLVEEAHLQASEKSRMDIGENVLSRCFRLARKRGIILVLCDQVPSELPPAIVANLGCRIVMRLVHPKDCWTMQNSMGLDRDQANLLTSLEKREAVVHYSLHPHAFMIRVPTLSFPPTPNGSDLLASGERMLSQVEWRTCTKPPVNNPQENRSNEGLTEDARLILMDLCREPGRTIEERCTILGLDRAREFRGRAVLEARGLIKMAGQLGGKVKLFASTDKGRQWADRQGIKVKTYKSGLVHEYLLYQSERGIGRIGPAWRMQRHSEIGRSQGLQPDLLILAPEGKRIILEVCCNNLDYEANNLLKEWQLPGVDGVVALTPDSATLRGLQKEIFKHSAKLPNPMAELPCTLNLLDAGQVLKEKFDWMILFEPILKLKDQS